MGRTKGPLCLQCPSGHKLQMHVREARLYDLVPDSTGLMLISYLNSKEWKHYIDISNGAGTMLENTKTRDSV